MNGDLHSLYKVNEDWWKEERGFSFMWAIDEEVSLLPPHLLPFISRSIWIIVHSINNELSDKRKKKRREINGGGGGGNWSGWVVNESNDSAKDLGK